MSRPSKDKLPACPTNPARSHALENHYKTTLVYLPLNTTTMLKAAELWAKASNLGKPTANNLRLDADAILAAQATLLLEDGDEVIVATSNVAHLSTLVPAAEWRTIA